MIAGRGSYFATIGRPSPLLHMWSLAVEEQFYVVLPLVLFATRRLVVARPARAAAISLAGAIASTVWMAKLVASHGDPSRAYWGSDSHAMGLLVGVALGVLAATEQPWTTWAARIRAHRAADALAGAALVALFVTMRYTGEHSYRLFHGGFLAFSLACGLVIAVVVACPDALATRVLRTPVLVAVGLRSYSLYLWHWPVGVFVAPSSGLHGASLFVVRAVVSVALAEGSYRLVERPFRTGIVARRSGSRGSVLYYAACVAVAGVLVMTVAAPKRLPPNDLARLRELAGNRVPGALRVDVFGDSTALVFGYNGAVHARELGVSVGGDSQLGCGIVQSDHVSGSRVIPNPPSCAGWRERWKASMDHDPHAVLALMTGAWEILDQRTHAGTVRFGTPAWTDLVRSGLRDALGFLTADGRTVRAFEVPCLGFGNPNDPLPERGDPRRIAVLNGMLDELAREMRHVEIVRWRSLVCPGGHRVEQIKGVRIWQPDDVHLTERGAVLVWKWWLPQLRAAATVR
jgi:peptidoglycan/LPS O-acetylase OafA/YrhL